MNTWRILRAQDRVNAARSRLNDFKNPPDKIICPAGLESRTYENLIDKIARIEACIAKHFIRGIRPKSTGNK